MANFFIGNYDEAVKYLLESIPYFEKVNYSKGIASNLNNLGLISRRQGDYVKALDYYKESIDYKREIGDLKGEMLTLGNISSIYIYLNDWSMALMFNEKSSQIAKELNHSQLAENYIDKATILHGMDRINESKKFYYKSIPLLKEEKLFQSLTVSYVGLASIYLKEKELDSAQYYFNEALTQLNNVDYADYRLKVLLGLAAVSVEKEEFEKSSDYLQSYIELNEKLLKASQSDEIKDLEAKYNYLSQKEKINKLNQDKVISDLIIQQNDLNEKVLWIGIVVIMIVLSYIIFLYRKVKSQKEITTDALLDKEILLKEIHHRVKNNLQLVSSLLYLQSEHIEDDAALKAITVSRTRVEAMAIIHQKLYKEDNIIELC